MTAKNRRFTAQFVESVMAEVFLNIYSYVTNNWQTEHLTS
jgi:hypothetical protein